MKNRQEVMHNRMKATSLFVEELPVLRLRIGISQDELADYVGISRQTLSSIELGKREITWHVFLSLVLFFSLQQKTNSALKQIPGFTDALRNCLNYDGSL